MIADRHSLIAERQKIAERTKKLMPEILKQEAEHLARKDDIMAAMRAELAAQREGWSFRCRRFGDFLSIEIERRANPAPKPWPGDPRRRDPRWGEDDPRRYAATINLGGVKTISLSAGAEPDLDGSIEYYIFEGRRADNPNGPWREFLTVESRAPRAPDERPILVPQPRKLQMQYQGGSNQADYSTKNMPRPASDDSLYLSGWGGIYVPTGLGRSVLDALHAELERGWPVREAAS